MHLASKLQQPLASPVQQPDASRGQGPEYEADSCGSPSGSPSPKEAEPGSSLAAGASSMEQSLEAQVRSEVARYALNEGRLRMLVEEQGASFSATVASVVVDKLCGFIAAAKGMSGTAHYALQATTEVSVEEARANLKTLEKNLNRYKGGGGVEVCARRPPPAGAVARGTY